MNRRNFLSKSTLAAGGAAFAFWLSWPKLLSKAESLADKDLVTIIKFSDSGKKLGASQMPKIRKTDAEWQKQLSPLQFDVTRRAGTERAFSGQYDIHEKGLYRCVCCDNTLFSSDTKFDSGTGWPSFWAPIAKENIRISNDSSLGISRDEVSCTECSAHLGHVFNDGPAPTYMRYCMNSVSLRFVKRA